MRDYIYRARYRGPIARLAGREALLRRSEVKGMVLVQFDTEPEDFGADYPDGLQPECFRWHELPACDFAGRSMIGHPRRLKRLGREDYY